MCGIFGVISKAGRCDVGAITRTGVGALTHRGPDGQGIYRASTQQWEIALGHTRLSIIDLSPAGSQPMSSANGQFHITFNGEIYNYQELRESFGVPYPFRGHSDTETILAGLQLQGIEFINRLRGMYAFGVMDSEEQSLRLVRDPLGIKPLYYFTDGELFVFGSEIRAILTLRPDKWRLSREALSTYLETGSVGEVASIVEGINSLAPGRELVVSYGGPTLIVQECARVPSWATPVPVPMNREDAVLELGEILKDSVRSHLVSDVPVSLFLSGGIDSSALLSLMREVSASRIQTFTVSFGKSELSEDSQARRIASRYNADHHEVVLSEEGLLARVKLALRAMDQPTFDGVNSFIVSEAVRQAGCKVAISGLGGDELFCGYPSFFRRVQLAKLGRLGPTVGVAASMIGKMFGAGAVRWEKGVDFLRSGARPEDVYRISRRLFPPLDVIGLLGFVGGQPTIARSLPNDYTNAISHLELSGYMRNTLLRDCDVMSMAHSLEVRVPFVDVRVCQYVLSLPGDWKLRNRRPKGLLLDVLGTRLPDYVWNRKKMGFTLPFEKWMLGALRDEITDTFRDGPLLEGCGLRPLVVRRAWHDFQADPKRWRWSRPWSLYVLARWSKEHGIRV